MAFGLKMRVASGSSPYEEHVSCVPPSLAFFFKLPANCNVDFGGTRATIMGQEVEAKFKEKQTTMVHGP